jgi:hypothetical protein
LLNTARAAHTATLLPSGQVLVTGGYDSGGNALASAELYDPVTNTWGAAGPLATARLGHTATLLPSGQVLVAGGVSYGVFLASAELYDPATNTWGAAGPLATGRVYPTATLLPSGKVLVAGGFGNITGGLLKVVELYDPATSTWSAAPSLATARENQTATLLSSGKVLIAGGFGASVLASTELYDPGLAPKPAVQPILSAVRAFLLQTEALTGTSAGSKYSGSAITATGFVPALEGSGGATNNSASNLPVMQVQRVDSDEMRLIANDESVSFTDTAFKSSTTALKDFPAGPVRVRVWVNGVPSAECYITFLDTDYIFVEGFEPARCH